MLKLNQLVNSQHYTYQMLRIRLVIQPVDLYLYPEILLLTCHTAVVPTLINLTLHYLQNNQRPYIQYIQPTNLLFNTLNDQVCTTIIYSTKPKALLLAINIQHDCKKINRWQIKYEYTKQQYNDLINVFTYYNLICYRNWNNFHSVVFVSRN